MTTPRTETAMSAALSRAGLNTADFRMRQAAQDALAKHHNNVQRALRTFKKLLDDELIDAALLFVLKELSAGGLDNCVNHVEPVLGRQADRDDAGHPLIGTHLEDAASSSRDGAGQVSADNHGASARPIREPSLQERDAQARIAKRLAITVLDTFTVRDGRAIGDVRFGELERLRTANAMEASVIRQIQRKFAHADHDAKIRDLLTAEDLNSMKQRAAEVADAA